MPNAASLLWRLARLIVSSGVAETAAERLVGRVKSVVTAPRADVPRESDPARIEALEAAIREQDRRLSAIAVTLEKLREDLRPLMLRSTITFWMALVALVLALVSLGLRLRG